MRSPHLRICFDLCGAISALAWTGLVVMNRLNHGPLDLTIFLSCIGIAWLGCLGAYLCAKQTGTITFQRIFLWAIIFRVITWFGTPIYDDVHYRYLWDGREFAEEGSPYTHTPAEKFGNNALPNNFQRILDQISNPQLHSTAQPLSQFLFLLSYIITPGETWPLKLLLSIADFIAIISLMQLVSPRQSLLYSWCPLLLLETYFHLHVELFAIALLLLGILHLSRRQYTPSVIASTLAVGIHPFSLFPCLWITSKSKATDWILSLLIIGSMYGYFFHHDGLLLFEGAWKQIKHTEFNSFGYGMAITHLPPLMSGGLCLLGFTLCLGVWLNDFQAHLREVPRFDWLFLALFLFLPAVYPAYLLWVLPWAILHPRAWTFTAMAVVTLSYCYGQNLPPSDLAPYSHPAWVRPIEVGTVAIVGLIEWMTGFLTKNWGVR